MNIARRSSIASGDRADQVRAAALAAACSPPDPDTIVQPSTSHKGYGTSLLIYTMLLVAASLIFCTTLAFAAPVLGHGWEPTWLAVGVVLFSLLVRISYVRAQLLRTGPKKVKRQTLLISLIVFLLTSSFAVGVLTDPVVVNGHIVANTSATAKSVRYVEKMRDDLYTMRSLDSKLAVSDAQTWAKSSELTSGSTKAQDIATYYKTMLDTTDLPDGALVEPTKHTITTAYTLAHGYDLKTQILRASTNDPKLQEQLASTRSTFAAELTTSGASLTEATDALGFDIDLSRRAK